MPMLSARLRTAALALAVGAAVQAEDPWNYSLKLAAGPTFGGLLSPLGRAGYAFGGDFELAYRQSASSRIAVSLGWRSFPGDFSNVSFIPYAYPATNVNPTVYETRVRKPEAQGFQLTALYRGALPGWEGFFWQGGLRIGANKLTETDTGTQLVTDGRSSTTSGNVTAVNTIAASQEKSTLSVGPMAGLGYEFREFVLEVNLCMATVQSPSLGKKTGLASELAFGFRF